VTWEEPLPAQAQAMLKVVQKLENLLVAKGCQIYCEV
jgi:hypothetical protein